jgi:hypothetical protein
MSKQSSGIRQRAALRSLIEDMAIAAGIEIDGDGDNEWWSGDPSTFGRLMRAIVRRWDLDDDGQYVVRYWNLEHYDTLDKLVDFLYENDLRA